MKRLERNEVKRVMMAMTGTARDVIEFIAMTGARVSEALAVTGYDVDACTGTVRIRTLKNPAHPIRRIQIGQEYAARLLADGLPEDPLFRITRQGVHKAMKAAAKAADVDPRRAHPHAIRHGWAIANAERGCPAPVLQALLGHASLETTTVYTREIDAMRWSPAAAM